MLRCSNLSLPNAHYGCAILVASLRAEQERISREAEDTWLTTS
jgi:hypothetical protein